MTDAKGQTSREPRPRSSSVSEGTTIRTLLAADLVDSTDFIRQVGDEKAAELFAAHDRLFRTLITKYKGREIDKTDGFLLVFRRPIEAVLYALAYQDGLASLSEEFGISVFSRVGIHLGEIVLRENTAEHIARGAKPLEVEGLAKPTTARRMSAALGKQILLSETAYEFARHAAVGHPQFESDVQWQEHDRYLFKGLDKPIRLYEVGRLAYAPFVAPADSEKVTRAQGSNAGNSKLRNLVVSISVIAMVLGVGMFWAMKSEQAALPVPPEKRQISNENIPAANQSPKSDRPSDVAVPKTNSADKTVKNASNSKLDVEDKKAEKAQAEAAKPTKKIDLELHVTTKPSDAKISVAGKVLGQSPLRWKPGNQTNSVLVKAQKPGYLAHEKSCDLSTAMETDGQAQCHLRLRRKKSPKPARASEEGNSDKDLKGDDKRVRIHVIE